MLTITDRFFRINQLFEKVAYKRPDIITRDGLVELYQSDPGIFGQRNLNESTLKVMNPTTASAWGIVLTTDNRKIDTWEKQSNSALRIEKVIRHYKLFSLEGIPRPRDEASLIAWLVTIDDRLRDYLLDIPGRSDEEVFEAVTCAFGIGKHELVRSPLRPQKYFGYRRSANDGDIIRFYFEVKGQSDKGILRFDNDFLRSPHPWIVDGHGFTIGNVSHMLGTAKSAPGASDGKGVRFFTLQAYEFGWLVGILDTRDNFGQPISARIVLVPVEQHAEGQAHDCDPSNDAFNDYLSASVQPAQLRQEVHVPDTQQQVLRGLATDELIQSLIWNGSLRTLHGEPQPIPSKKAHAGLRRLIHLQNRVLALGKQPPNDTYFFRHLLTNGDVYEAVDQYLSKLERRRSVGARPIA